MNSRLLFARINDAIGANEILSKLQPFSMRKLRAGGRFKEVERGAAICHQEAAAARLWLVVRGEVKLVRYTIRGAALLLDIVLPNQLFGTVFYHRNPVYPFTAVAMQRTELLSFRSQDLIDDLARNPTLQKMLLADTSYQLCQAQQMRGLWLEEARVRISHLLLYLYEKFGRVIPETRATLAELAGTSVETAIRISNALAQHGILATRRGQIEILSVAGLRACAQGN